MPEASMNKDDFSPFRENKVGLSWKAGVIQPVSIPKRVKQSAKE
jgi:hypothetical protein